MHKLHPLVSKSWHLPPQHSQNLIISLLISPSSHQMQCLFNFHLLLCIEVEGLQCCVRMKWIGCMYTDISPSWTSLQPHFLYPMHLGHHRAQLSSVLHSRLPLGCLHMAAHICQSQSPICPPASLCPLIFSLLQSNGYRRYGTCVQWNIVQIIKSAGSFAEALRWT